MSAIDEVVKRRRWAEFTYQDEHARCDRGQPSCQNCLENDQECIYKRLKTRKSTNDTLTPQSEQIEVTSDVAKPTIKSGEYHNANPSPSVLQTVREWKAAHTRLPEHIVQQSANHQNIRRARWINLEGDELAATRCKVGRDEWVTIVEKDGHKPCIVGVKQRLPLDSFHCSTYAVWRGLSGEESKASVFKVVLKHNLPNSRILHLIQHYQQTKRTYSGSKPSAKKRKQGQIQQDTQNGATERLQSSSSISRFPAELPPHLTSLINEYIKSNPDAKPLECANLHQNKNLLVFKSGERALWVSKDGFPLTVQQYSLGEYGWITVASGESFPPQIVKYHPELQTGNSGVSSWFTWHGTSGWGQSLVPSVFKYPEGDAMPKVSELVDESTDIAVGTPAMADSGSKTPAPDRRTSARLEKQSARSAGSRESRYRDSARAPPHSTGNLPAQLGYARKSFLGRSSISEKPTRRLLPQKTDTSNQADSPLMIFRGTRPRRRPFTLCNSPEQMFRQVKAAGLLETEEDDSVLLFKLSTGREAAIVRTSEGELDELDFEEFVEAIHADGPEEVEVMPFAQ